MIYTVIIIGPSDNTDNFDDESVTLNPIFNDESGLVDLVEFDPNAITDGLPLFPPAPDLIYIHPDWPPIGSPDFAEQLRNWHAQNNAQLITKHT